MITRADVADLQPGDVVELRYSEWPKGSTVRGPLYVRPLGLCCAGFAVRWANGDPMEGLGECWTAELISRAPRLYVNSDRTEPVPGDVVRDELGNKLALYIFAPEEGGDPWWLDTAADWISPAEMREKRLRLLVDGETGQVVP